MCWNKCASCGKFISYEDFENGSAERYMITPDTQFSVEKFENICKRCLLKCTECGKTFVKYQNKHTDQKLCKDCLSGFIGVDPLID